MWTIIGGILATASRIDEGGGDKDLNIYLTDNAGVQLVRGVNARLPVQRIDHKTGVICQNDPACLLPHGFCLN